MPVAEFLSRLENKGKSIIAEQGYVYGSLEEFHPWNVFRIEKYQTITISIQTIINIEDTLINTHLHSFFFKNWIDILCQKRWKK